MSPRPRYKTERSPTDGDGRAFDRLAYFGAMFGSRWIPALEIWAPTPFLGAGGLGGQFIDAVMNTDSKVGENLYPDEFIKHRWVYALGATLVIVGIVCAQRGSEILGGLLACGVPLVFVVEAALRMPRLRAEAFELLERNAHAMTVREIDRELQFIAQRYASGGRESERRAEEIRRRARDASEPAP